MGKKTNHAENNDWDHSGKVSESEAIDDVGGWSHDTTMGKFFDWLIGIAGHDFSDIAYDHSSDKSSCSA